jgi:hypothetical protein
MNRETLYHLAFLSLNPVTVFATFLLQLLNEAIANSQSIGNDRQTGANTGMRRKEAAIYNIEIMHFMGTAV